MQRETLLCWVVINGAILASWQTAAPWSSWIWDSVGWQLDVLQGLKSGRHHVWNAAERKNSNTSKPPALFCCCAYSLHPIWIKLTYLCKSDCYLHSMRREKPDCPISGVEDKPEFTVCVYIFKLLWLLNNNTQPSERRLWRLCNSNLDPVWAMHAPFQPVWAS